MSCFFFFFSHNNTFPTFHHTVILPVAFPDGLTTCSVEGLYRTVFPHWFEQLRALSSLRLSDEDHKAIVQHRLNPKLFSFKSEPPGILPIVISNIPVSLAKRVVWAAPASWIREMEAITRDPIRLREGNPPVQYLHRTNEGTTTTVIPIIPCLGELINQARILATSAVSIAWESLPDLSLTLRTGPRDSTDREPTPLFKKVDIQKTFSIKGATGARGTKQQKPEALFAYHELALMVLEAAKLRSQRHRPPSTPLQNKRIILQFTGGRRQSFVIKMDRLDIDLVQFRDVVARKGANLEEEESFCDSSQTPIPRENEKYIRIDQIMVDGNKVLLGLKI